MAPSLWIERSSGPLSSSSSRAVVPERGQPSTRIGRCGGGASGSTAESGWATRGTLRRSRRNARRSGKGTMRRTSDFTARNARRARRAIVPAPMADGFDAETELQPAGDGVWDGAIAEGWDTPRGPLGGYVMAILMRGLEVAVADDARQARSVTMHFLRV